CGRLFGGRRLGLGLSWGVSGFGSGFRLAGGGLVGAFSGLVLGLGVAQTELREEVCVHVAQLGGGLAAGIGRHVAVVVVDALAATAAAAPAGASTGTS